MFSPLKLNIRLLVATAAFNQLVPLVADCVLLIRVAAVFPKRTVSNLVRYTLLGIPILLKIGRLVCIGLFASYFVRKGQELGPLLVLKALIPSPYMYAEAIMQTCDNGFCSILFLYKLNQQQNLRKTRAGLAKRPSAESTISRVRRLFIAALSSFLLPFLTNIAIIILSPLKPQDEPITIMVAINAYVTIYSLLFATVWVPTGDPLGTALTAQTGSHAWSSGDAVLRDRCTYCSSRRLSTKINPSDFEALANYSGIKSPTYSTAGSRVANPPIGSAITPVGLGHSSLEMRRIPQKSVNSIRVDEKTERNSRELGGRLQQSLRPTHVLQEEEEEETTTWSLSSTAADDVVLSSPSGHSTPLRSIEGSPGLRLNGFGPRRGPPADGVRVHIERQSISSASTPP
ncbi:unnamed protein product [Tilletia laevis]|uniref:Uncharacterized protein n=2 Tax=Tilletia TaxID=13289 RepID=A0A177VEU8_9BASI|nr:hypothetical protein CF336_g382 [Tilletia laevis]KAE8256480.1 hypothetical protein A4X03_0g5366 [Tilletia caries]CAD6903960.1 unnamed protein product [Tilletia controversa]CAD6884438.1 unnamed protein product [Tilletia caries]CAD6903802.1 unnamed protein product [Tilletia caries]